MFDQIEKGYNDLQFRISELEKNQKKMMDVQDSYAARQDWWLKNWWRVAGMTLPVLFMLGEISLWIRRLV